jgi:hypothetical protein
VGVGAGGWSPVRPEASSLLDDVVGHLYTPRAMATLFMFMCL